MQKRTKGQKMSTTNFDIEVGFVLQNERKRQGKNQEDIAKWQQHYNQIILMGK